MKYGRVTDKDDCFIFLTLDHLVASNTLSLAAAPFPVSKFNRLISLRDYREVPKSTIVRCLRVRQAH